MSLTCERSRELLVDHYYGELAPSERREMAAHLTSCAACALEYCRLDADLGGLTELLGEEPRPEVESRLRRAVEREFRPGLWRRLWRVGLFPVPAYQTALLVVALLVALALLVGQQGRERAAEHGPAPRTTTLFDSYDASQIVPLDPRVL